MAKKRLIIRNFTTLTAFDGGQRYRIVRNEAGEELGIEVSGVLTTFDVPNENGTEFTRESYDKFVDDYFIANSINVPLVLYHNDTDPRTVAGIVKSLTKTDSGVELVGYIPKSAYYYNLIKAQIAEGILQGFSNYGGVRDYEYIENEDGSWTLKVTDFVLMHASLVTTPADTGALMDVQNTVFRGFGGRANDNSEDSINNEVTLKQQSEPWRLLV